jgi:large subunit ribosomal protein L6
MSRVAKSPVSIPKGVEVTLAGSSIKVKGAKGELSRELNDLVNVVKGEDSLEVKVNKESKEAWAQAGTARSLVNNMVLGVSQGFEKKLQLNGVGYRAQSKGKTLDLTLGFSHPVVFKVPEGLEVSTPSQTEIVVSGVDKQQVGQAAADIRAFRPPEPYKGKGVRYADEYVRRKEAKKK